MNGETPPADATKPVDESGQPPPGRRIITTRAEYLEAFDQLIDRVERTLRIFDADGAELGLNNAARIERLRAFLQGHPANRLLFAMHTPEHLERSAPRFRKLITLCSQQIECRRTQGDGARAQECFALADELHLVRRAAQSHPRGVVVDADLAQGQPMLQRFEDIWASAEPCLAPTTLGL